MKKLAISLFFYFLFTNTVYYQKEYTKISCKVLDLTSKEPVVYATVMLKKNNRGTHANLNGNFEIPIKYQQNGIIKISSIGYKSKQIKLSDLKLNITNIIYLSKSNNNLQEVVIKSSKRKKKLLAKQIVRKSIENILENYPTQSHSYISYYRDYQQPVDNSYQNLIKSKNRIEYLNVHEAIIESFDNGYKSDKLKSKKNQNLLYKYIVNKISFKILL